MEQIENIVSPIETVLNRALSNVYINTALKVFLGLYAAFAAPKLPHSVVNLMDNTVMRIFVGFMIVLLATKDPALALMVSIAFIITLQTANKYRLINTSLSVSSPGESSWLPSVSNKVVRPNTELGINTSVGPPNLLPEFLRNKINNIAKFTDGMTPSSDDDSGMTPSSDDDSGMTPSSDDDYGMTPSTENDSDMNPSPAVGGPGGMAEYFTDSMSGANYSNNQSGDPLTQLPISPKEVAALTNTDPPSNFDLLKYNVAKNARSLNLLSEELKKHKDIPHLVIPELDGGTLSPDDISTVSNFGIQVSSPDPPPEADRSLLQGVTGDNTGTGQIANFQNFNSNDATYNQSELESALHDAMNEINNFKPPAVSEDVTHESVVDSNVDNLDKNNDSVADNNVLSAYSDPNTGVSQEEIEVMNLSMPSLNLKQAVKNFSEVGNLKNDPFTSTYQFLDAQDNMVPDSNAESSQHTFNNQFCTHGIN